MTFIIEQAGGLGIDGEKRILDISPKSIHQKSAIFIGTYEMVRLVSKFIKSKQFN